VEKVLVVDDSLSVRKAIERILAPRGLAVASCASGREALARLPEDAPDLLICDVVLPDLDGYEVCAWLRRTPALAATAVLFISGIVGPEVEQRAASLGVERVLRKPFTGDELVAAVEHILASSRMPPWPRPPDAASTPVAPPVPGPESPPAFAASPRQRELFAELSNLPGFCYALLLSAAPPQVLTIAGELPPAAARAAAEPLSSWLAAAAAATAQLDLGEPGAAVLEAEAGTLLARRIDARATLVLVLSSSGALGKARLYLAKLQRALLAGPS
jgi:CheY-like chemotaxis protein/predicted regulator of Ras-like GTPase activity (Roadblock/LC7/MglB family)